MQKFTFPLWFIKHSTNFSSRFFSSSDEHLFTLHLECLFLSHSHVIRLLLMLLYTSQRKKFTVNGSHTNQHRQHTDTLIQWKLIIKTFTGTQNIDVNMNINNQNSNSPFHIHAYFKYHF